MWNFQHFSVTQILREINFGESGSSKTAFFAILGAMKFVILINYIQPSKNAKIHINQNSEPLNALKWQILHF